MNYKNILISYKITFALLGFSAVITEIATLVERGFFKPFSFFSYFTIQSNIFAFIVLIMGALAVANNERSSRFNLLRGAATLYMVITGIVFAVLLAGVEGSILTAAPWDNIVLHYIMPVVLLMDWLVDKPSKAITFKSSAVWLLYPVTYVIYSLIRGRIVNWYPYPFLDPKNNGYIGVLLTGLAIAGLTIALMHVLTRFTRRKSSDSRR